MTGSLVVVGPSERIEKRWQLEICKVADDDEKRVFYGWASVIEKHGVEVVDHDNDSWEEAEMEETAFRFVTDNPEHGENHQRLAGSDLVASIPFTKDLQDALGIDLGLVGWLLGFRVHDDALWKRIKSGELSMLSIGGSGFREEVAA